MKRKAGTVVPIRAPQRAYDAAREKEENVIRRLQ